MKRIDRPPTPRRVLFIDHTARLGGGEVALLNLVTALDRHRYTPIVLLFADGPLRQKLIERGVETHVLPLAASIADARKDTLGGGTLRRVRDGVTMLSFIACVRRAICDARVHLVHTNTLKADVIGGLAARLAGVPVVWHVRDRIADDYLPPRVARMFRRLARRIPTALIANSQATLQTLGNLTPGEPARLGRKRAWVVHDGTILPPLPRPTGKTRDGAVVGLVGRIASWKGQHVFIEAAARVRRRFPNARFRIIGAALFGEDDYERQLHATVDALGLKDVVEFAGFRADVEAAIAELDLLVHASTTGEPFGQVIIEGMAAAKAVVATRGGGVPEIVLDGETGFLVPMGDAAAMADAIEALLSDPARREFMGLRGRSHVHTHFTIDRVAQNVCRVFDAVLVGRE
ncbi:MAG TPA: glycosyltransferase family 4 protein [Tepidisphaeraceae bacterium]